MRRWKKRIMWGINEEEDESNDEEEVEGEYRMARGCMEGITK